MSDVTCFFPSLTLNKIVSSLYENNTFIRQQQAAAKQVVCWIAYD